MVGKEYWSKLFYFGFQSGGIFFISCSTSIISLLFSCKPSPFCVLMICIFMHLTLHEYIYCITEEGDRVAKFCVYVVIVIMKIC